MIAPGLFRSETGVAGSAVYSPEEPAIYRYRLERRWGPDGSKAAIWVLLNPSTATHDVDDPTIRRCIGYSKRWGYDGLVILNLFGIRSTNPSAIYHRSLEDSIGPGNDYVIAETIEQNPGRVFCGWGAHGGRAHRRGESVLEIILGAGGIPHALALTQMLEPRHPLYLRADLEPFAYASPGPQR